MAKRAIARMRVSRTEWLTPHMIRVVLRGPFVDNGFTDKYVKLMFLRPDVEYPEPIDLDEIRRDFLREQWPTTRTYTVRWADAATGEFAIDFVTHGDEGIAAPWAAAAQPGDEVIVRGPGGAYAPDPAAAWHLLVGDESAIPAIGAALEALPAGVSARAFVQVADESEVQKLASPGEVEITWLYRTDHPTPAAAGEALVEQVRTLEFLPGDVQVFVHGEAGFVAGLRRHLTAERGVPREALSISGYWRRGKNEDGWQAEKAETRRQEEATNRA
ncbi:MAG TPA: siderophore-interacting protein [Pseudonocardiaceae bacterium]|jgi:NADPH-dependent ferric siderophore reductase|nr:siderophore-interacting protein [Pseudonocardiaceae bacterium]